MRAVLLCPLPIEFYEVKCRLQPLVNERNVLREERPRGCDSKFKVQFYQALLCPGGTPALYVPSGNQLLGLFRISGPMQLRSTAGQPTHKRWRGRLWRTPANTPAKELSQFSICVPHQRSQLARKHSAAFKIQSTKLFL